jgi:hypothetical protein
MRRAVASSRQLRLAPVQALAAFNLAMPLRALNVPVPDDLLAHVAPLGWEQIALTGDYVWANLPLTAEFKPLREVQAPFRAQAA